MRGVNHEPARVDSAMTVCEHKGNGSDQEHARIGAARGRRRLEPESVKIIPRLFLHVAAPGLLIGAVLLVTCLAASWSVNRLQAGMSRILSHDLASWQAAQELDTHLRQLRYHSFLYLVEPKPTRAHAVQQDEHDFEAALEQARRLATGPGQLKLLDRISAGYRRYRDEVDRAGHAPAAPGGVNIARWDDVHPIRHLLAPCQELMHDSRLAMDQTAEDALAVGRRVGTALLLLGVLGPLSGLGIGYGVARGLSHSIARLNVRLRDVHAHLEQEVGSVDVEADGDLSVLDQRVERVVEQVSAVIEELNRKREEVLRAEQLAAVGQLAASVAHEIRNPLTGIKMIVDVARSDPRQRGLTAEDLDVIHAEVERIERKVQGLLDYARPPAPRRLPVDLRETVHQALRLIRKRLEQQGVQQEVHLPDVPVNYEVDIDQFAGVLVNLFLNALDAMPRGGQLTVDLESANGGPIELSVTDTGTGVPAAMQQRLFVPFASSKPTGTGLGLSTSRRVVEEHGGRLVASNLPGGGARFSIQLPPEGGGAGEGSPPARESGAGRGVNAQVADRR